MEEPAIDRINDPKKEELIAYINRLSAFLSAKKKKAILEADLLKISREITYMGLGIEETRKKIDLNRGSIAKISPKITEFRDKLSSLEQEKQPLENEYNRLQDIQINFEKKRTDIENKKSMVEQLTMDIRNIQEETLALKERETLTRDRKQHAQEEIDSGKHNLSKLDEEIEVMTTTRDLLTGQIPDFIDIEEFPSLQSADQGAEAYTSDVKDAMEKMENDISTCKNGIAESHDLEASLSLEKKDLEIRFKTLKTKVKPDLDKKGLSLEVATLSEQKEAFASEIATHQDEIFRLQPMVTTHEKKLGIERESDLELDEKVQYFTERKQFISTLDDVEVEMERLKGQIAKSTIDYETNNSYLTIINKVSGEMETINRKEKMSFEVCDKALLEVQNIVLLGHGILYGSSPG